MKITRISATAGALTCVTVDVDADNGMNSGSNNRIRCSKAFHFNIRVHAKMLTLRARESSVSLRLVNHDHAKHVSYSLNS